MNKEMIKLGLESSVIRELSACANKRKKDIGSHLVYDFTIGNPNVKAPKIVNDNLKKLIDEYSDSYLHDYTENVGNAFVREKLIENINEVYGCNENKDLLYLTNGASTSLSVALHALINRGDEVIIFAPYFPEYTVFINAVGGIVKAVQTNENDGFIPNLEVLEEKITKNTKMIIINSPNNPTGVVYSEKFIIDLCTVLEKKQKQFNQVIYLLSDEPYRELIYSNTKYPFITNYYSNSLVAYSYSKSLSLPGERIGYLLVSNKCQDKELVFAAVKGAGRSIGCICAPSIFQYLLPTVFNVTSDFSIYIKNRDLLIDILSNAGYSIAAKPEGAFYLFVKSLDKDAIAFCKKATEFNLFMVPSDSFGMEGYVRISYCVSSEMIASSEEAFIKLKQYYEECC
ncbi:MAG: pyridoxal phosphate-dependent aminotransferase [Bacilli bacterium]